MGKMFYSVKRLPLRVLVYRISEENVFIFHVHER